MVKEDWAPQEGRMDRKMVVLGHVLGVIAGEVTYVGEKEPSFKCKEEKIYSQLCGEYGATGKEVSDAIEDGINKRLISRSGEYIEIRTCKEEK